MFLRIIAVYYHSIHAVTSNIFLQNILYNMLTYHEQIELRIKVVKNKIPIKEAMEIYWKDFKPGGRSWHTKDWKERRASVIKENCEICGSKETLTLQHLSHPKKYREYKNEVARKYTNCLIESNDQIGEEELRENILSHYEYFPVPLCPKCKGRKPNARTVKSPKFRCTKCSHEFDQPVYKSIDELLTILYEDEYSIEARDKSFVSKDKWRNNFNIKQVRYWLIREKATTHQEELIEKEAFLLYLDDTIKYLSFAETITACKKCASYFDLYQMELCPKCTNYYKGFEYSTCIQCLPEEKRKLALEKVAFGKQWRKMEKDLGIG